MSTHTLTDQEVWTLANALRAAADTYSTDAHRFDSENQPTLAQQFRDQRSIALAWARRVEQAESLTIVETSVT